MSKTFDLKKGLNIPISGCAQPVVSKIVAPDTVSVSPEDFKGFLPRLLVKEGDRVLAGSPLMADKKNPEILLTSPVSGTVKEIVRGDKRKLLAVRIGLDATPEFLEFGPMDPSAMDAAQVKEALLKSGLWLSLVQRPYGIIADPAVSPKAIFISSFSSAPLAADTEFTLGDEIETLQIAINALSKLGKVYLGLSSGNSAFAKLEGCEKNVFKGAHPAGNVGVQIAAVSPIRKDETVWTVNMTLLLSIGRFFKKGRYCLKRKVAVTGPAAEGASYVEAVPGMGMGELSNFFGGSTEGLRLISGDVLSGKNVGTEGTLGFFDSQVTIIKEGTEEELFGWAKPLRLSRFSADHSYFHWCLLPFMKAKKYDMDTNLHGGPRAFVMSDSYYGKFLPMDIYPLYLTKACLAGDIEKMEKFGIYEVLPEDLALCEFADPSKNYIQDIISKGIDLMLKEMA